MLLCRGNTLLLVIVVVASFVVVRQYTGDDDDDVVVEVVLGFVVLRGAIVASVVCFVEILILFDKCRNVEIVSWR